MAGDRRQHDDRGRGGGSFEHSRLLLQQGSVGRLAHSLSADRNGRSNARMTAPATMAMPAIMRKNIILSMLLQKLPSQPAMKLPVKLEASQIPIIIETMRAGLTLVTSDSPIGER